MTVEFDQMDQEMHSAGGNASGAVSDFVACKKEEVNVIQEESNGLPVEPETTTTDLIQGTDMQEDHGQTMDLSSVEMMETVKDEMETASSPNEEDEPSHKPDESLPSATQESAMSPLELRQPLFKRKLPSLPLPKPRILQQQTPTTPSWRREPKEARRPFHVLVDASCLTTCYAHALSDRHVDVLGYVGGKWFSEKQMCHVAHVVASRRSVPDLLAGRIVESNTSLEEASAVFESMGLECVGFYYSQHSQHLLNPDEAMRRMTCLRASKGGEYVVLTVHTKTASSDQSLSCSLSSVVYQNASFPDNLGVKVPQNRVLLRVREQAYGAPRALREYQRLLSLQRHEAHEAYRGQSSECARRPTQRLVVDAAYEAHLLDCLSKSTVQSVQSIELEYMKLAMAKMHVKTLIKQRAQEIADAWMSRSSVYPLPVAVAGTSMEQLCLDSIEQYVFDACQSVKHEFGEPSGPRQLASLLDSLHARATLTSRKLKWPAQSSVSTSLSPRMIAPLSNPSLISSMARRAGAWPPTQTPLLKLVPSKNESNGTAAREKENNETSIKRPASSPPLNSAKRVSVE